MNDIEVAKLKKLYKGSDKYADSFPNDPDLITIESLTAKWLMTGKIRDYQSVPAEIITDFIADAATLPRIYFVIELIRLNYQDTFKDFLIACLDHEYIDVKTSAVRALSYSQSQDIKKAFESRLLTKNQQFKAALVEALASYSHDKIPPYILELFCSTDTREEAVESLRNIQTVQANDLLIESLMEKHKRTADKAFQILSERNTVLIKTKIREDIHSKNAYAKLLHVKMIGELQDEESIELLVSLYASGSIKLKQQILLSLGKLGSSAAMQHIMDILKQEDNIDTASYGYIGLGQCPFPEAVEFLYATATEKQFGSGQIKLLTCSNLYELAAQSVKKNQCETAARRMIDLLAEDDSRIKIEMAKGLATRKFVEALPTLKTGLETETNQDVIKAFENAIKKLEKAAK